MGKRGERRRVRKGDSRKEMRGKMGRGKRERE